MKKQNKMIEINKDNKQELYMKDQTFYQNWAIMNEEIKSFMNNARPHTFDTIFGEDSERLYTHFRLDCNDNFLHFMGYLTQDQINTLILNIHLNNNLLYI